MKISELIKKLQEQQELVGDKEVYINTILEDMHTALTISDVFYIETYGEICIDAI